MIPRKISWNPDTTKNEMIKVGKPNANSWFPLITVKSVINAAINPRALSTTPRNSANLKRIRLVEMKPFIPWSIRSRKLFFDLPLFRTMFT
jgi:hypothetical protein